MALAQELTREREQARCTGGHDHGSRSRCPCYSGGRSLALDDLAGRLKSRWLTTLAEPDARGIRVGFLSTSALTKVDEISDFPERLSPVQVDDKSGTIEQMARPALKARIRKDNVTIDIVSVHLQSKLLSYPGGRFSPRDEGERARYSVYALHRQAAEASAVRAGAVELLGGVGRENRVIIAGDLNDEPQAATTQILLGPGGSEFGTNDFDRADKGDADRMWNLERLIPGKSGLLVSIAASAI